MDSGQRMNQELHNYLRRCRNPGFAMAAVASLHRRAFWSLLRRVAPRHQRLFLPAGVRAGRRLLLSSLTDRGPDPVITPPGQRTGYLLSLATGTLAWDGEQSWSTVFDDPEETDSLHRWNWLLRSAGREEGPPMSFEAGLSLVRSWLHWDSTSQEISHDTYSACERIANGCLFILLHGQCDVPHDIALCFRGMTRSIAQNLEYGRADLTGNHAFNNARALLIAGVMVDIPEAVRLAEAIASERLPVLVTSEGFLREGSMHYHFLFTRWVLEMLWLTGGAARPALVDLLAHYGRRLVERCWFFLVQGAEGCWEAPLMGDVSPDCPPEWLYALPWSAPARELMAPPTLPRPPPRPGWAAHFGCAGGSGSARPDQVLQYPESGWYRVDRHPWTLFVHGLSTDGRTRAGHQHHDLVGFSLFLHGAPLMPDCGRLNYTKSPLGTYGLSSFAHNSIWIDGLAPCSEGPTWLSSRYRSARVCVSVTDTSDHTEVHIEHDGFRRGSRSGVLHSRRIRLTANAVTIVDAFKDCRRLDVDVRFHFAPGIPIHEGTDAGAWRVGEVAAFRASGAKQVSVQSGLNRPPFGGLFFPAYGLEHHAHTIHLSYEVACPGAIIHTLTQGPCH